ncbi:MAG: S8 family serine peptidase, partial [Chiayiivirga sp.]|nr:S8 family serine peptidase [Chiayiivirga sp.]
MIAANHTNTDGVAGACKNCGLVSGRIIQDTCLSSGIVFPYINQVAPWVGLTLLAETGTQVVNMSFGGQGNGTFDYPKNVCADPLFQNDPECLTIAYASSQGVLMVAASGNDRGRLNFPASDPRVASVGGLDESLDFWDEDRDSPPNHVDDCPFYLASNSDSECGSNYTVNAATDARQEHVAPARRVLSTLYPGMPWSPTILCDDAALGTNGDGQGPCTGTSMSAPLVSGLAGILRPINPL